jgi:hypothetical protein
MSWLSSFLGLNKIKTPKVQKPEELMPIGAFDDDTYLKNLSNKSGYEKTIITGKKKKLAAPTQLG